MVHKRKRCSFFIIVRRLTNEASYWDSASSKFIVFFEIVKALAKGEKQNNGEFGELEIR
jgi:hypothetical protein